ncbi:restriction endonuclease [Nocardia sp. MW-W600-9]
MVGSADCRCWIRRSFVVRRAVRRCLHHQPQQAEQNAAVQMRAMGFTDAVVTANGADGGIDVLSSSALARVKWRGGAVSRPDVQQLFGARGSEFGKALLFFAASDYSQPAVEYADQHSIALLIYHPTGQVEPRNPYAAALLGGCRRGGDDPGPIGLRGVRKGPVRSIEVRREGPLEKLVVGRRGKGKVEGERRGQGIGRVETGASAHCSPVLRS